MPRTSTRRSQTTPTPAPAAATTPVATTPPSRRSNPLAALRQTASAGAAVSSRSSSVAIVEAPSRQVDSAIIKWNDAYAREKQAKSDREEAEGVIQPSATELRTARCQASSSIVASIRLRASNQDTLLFQQSERCCKIKAQEKQPDGQIIDNESRLFTAVGEDFDRLFKTKTILKIDGEKLAELPNASLVIERLTETLQRLEAEGIVQDASKILEDETVIVPTKQYYLARLGLVSPDLKQKTQILEQNGLVKPIEPSFKP